MDFAKQGAAALTGSDFKTAIEVYTKALIEHPTSPDYFTQRSIALSRVKPPKHDLALQDAEYAVLCGQKRGKRDKIQAAQQRRVVAYYNLERYADAKLVLDAMKRWRPSNSKPQEMEHNMWEAKINGKLKLNPQEPSTQEYPSTPLPEEKALQKQLKKQLKKDGSFNYSGEDPDVDTEDRSSTVQPPSQLTQESSQNAATASKIAVPLQKIRHEWYQNNQSVIVTIYAKGVPKDRAEIDIEADAISVTFPHPADPSTAFTFNLDPLYALIDPTRSKSQVMSTKIELTLAKSVPSQKWPSVEGSVPLRKTGVGESKDDAAKAAIMSTLNQPSTISPPPVSAPSYPTSSKNGPKNWDKLVDDLTAKKPKKTKENADKSKKAESDSDGEADDGYESDMGGDAVDGFFKKLYSGADPDTRRAMMKSFQESNGTALSTNWTDVGSRHVDEVQSKDDS